MWAALCLGFFLLLRASEYLDVGRTVPGRGLLCEHVTLLAKGTPVTRDNFGDADEVRILVHGPKTDIYNKGETSNHSHISNEIMARDSVLLKP